MNKNFFNYIRFCCRCGKPFTTQAKKGKICGECDKRWYKKIESSLKQV